MNKQSLNVLHGNAPETENSGNYLLETTEIEKTPFTMVEDHKNEEMFIAFGRYKMLNLEYKKQYTLKMIKAEIEKNKWELIFVLANIIMDKREELKAEINEKEVK